MTKLRIINEANSSYNAFFENEILTKISEFTVLTLSFMNIHARLHPLWMII